MGWGLFGDHGFRYYSYPYENPNREGGYIVTASENDIENESVYVLDSFPSYDDAYSTEVAIQIRSHYQKIESDLWAYAVYGKLLLSSGFTIDTYYSKYTEKLDGAYNYVFNKESINLELR